MFSGIVFCNDCGGNLYYCTAKNLTHEENWFTCSTSRLNKDNLSGKLSDDRFAQLSKIYEDEQSEKKKLAEKLRTKIEALQYIKSPPLRFIRFGEH